MRGGGGLADVGGSAFAAEGGDGEDAETHFLGGLAAGTEVAGAGGSWEEVESLDGMRLGVPCVRLHTLQAQKQRGLCTFAEELRCVAGVQCALRPLHCYISYLAVDKRAISPDLKSGKTIKFGNLVGKLGLCSIFKVYVSVNVLFCNCFGHFYLFFA